VEADVYTPDAKDFQLRAFVRPPGSNALIIDHWICRVASIAMSQTFSEG